MTNNIPLSLGIQMMLLMEDVMRVHYSLLLMEFHEHCERGRAA